MVVTAGHLSHDRAEMEIQETSEELHFQLAESQQQFEDLKEKFLISQATAYSLAKQLNKYKCEEDKDIIDSVLRDEVQFIEQKLAEKLRAEMEIQEINEDLQFQLVESQLQFEELKEKFLISQATAYSLAKRLNTYKCEEDKDIIDSVLRDEVQFIEEKLAEKLRAEMEIQESNKYLHLQLSERHLQFEDLKEKFLISQATAYSLAKQLHKYKCEEDKDIIDSVLRDEVQFIEEKLAEKLRQAEELRQYKALVHSQAKELTQLREKLREGRDASRSLYQHLKALLTPGDPDKSQDQHLQVQLAEGHRLAERLVNKLSPESDEDEDEGVTDEEVEKVQESPAPRGVQKAEEKEVPQDSLEECAVPRPNSHGASASNQPHRSATVTFEGDKVDPALFVDSECSQDEGEETSNILPGNQKDHEKEEGKAPVPPRLSQELPEVKDQEVPEDSFEEIYLTPSVQRDLSDCHQPYSGILSTLDDQLTCSALDVASPTHETCPQGTCSGHLSYYLSEGQTSQTQPESNTLVPNCLGLQLDQGFDCGNGLARRGLSSTTCNFTELVLEPSVGMENPPQLEDDALEGSSTQWRQVTGHTHASGVWKPKMIQRKLRSSKWTPYSSRLGCRGNQKDHGEEEGKAPVAPRLSQELPEVEEQEVPEDSLDEICLTPSVQHDLSDCHQPYSGTLSSLDDQLTCSVLDVTSPTQDTCPQGSCSEDLIYYLSEVQVSQTQLEPSTLEPNCLPFQELVLEPSVGMKNPPQLEDDALEGSADNTQGHQVTGHIHASSVLKPKMIKRKLRFSKWIPWPSRLGCRGNQKDHEKEEGKAPVSPRLSQELPEVKDQEVPEDSLEEICLTPSVQRDLSDCHQPYSSTLSSLDDQLTCSALDVASPIQETCPQGTCSGDLSYFLSEVQASQTQLEQSTQVPISLGPQLDQGFNCGNSLARWDLSSTTCDFTADADSGTQCPFQELVLEPSVGIKNPPQLEDDALEGSADNTQWRQVTGHIHASSVWKPKKIKRKLWSSKRIPYPSCLGCRAPTQETSPQGTCSGDLSYYLSEVQASQTQLEPCTLVPNYLGLQMDQGFDCGNGLASQCLSSTACSFIAKADSGIQCPFQELVLEPSVGLKNTPQLEDDALEGSADNTQGHQVTGHIHASGVWKPKMIKRKLRFSKWIPWPSRLGCRGNQKDHEKEEGKAPVPPRLSQELPEVKEQEVPEDSLEEIYLTPSVQRDLSDCHQPYSGTLSSLDDQLTCSALDVACTRYYQKDAKDERMPKK
ncbi:NBPF family member NBPF11-like [Saimiri boliviensis]|uniref:NBPF family member NBPF11-like n=1 Tax=Saimiri boliviensis TaxID=27679 RepID=UPI003D77C985